MSEENIFNYTDTYNLETNSLGGEEFLGVSPQIDFNNADNNPSSISLTALNNTNISNGLQYFNERDLITSNAFLTKAEKQSQLAALNSKERRTRLNRYSKKRRGGVLRYPLEALTEQTDYLQIDIEEYVALGGYVSNPGDNNRYVTGNIFGSDRAGRRSSNRLSKKPLINTGTILLPIPSNLQDSNNVQYDESTLNGLAAVGVQAADNFMNIDLSKDITSQAVDIAASAKKGVREGVGSSAAARNAFSKFLASKAANIFKANVTPNQLLARSNGEILNPNMELLFGSPTLRNFRFQFKMTPRNEKEAQQVRLIIRAFKRNMATQAQGGTLESGNFFLKTPNVFKLRYRTGRKNHPFLNRFKQCFLSSMNTTYTGEGVYSTYDDGTPVSMQLDLSFKEIQPIYDIDYDSRPGTEAVGY